MSKLERWPCWIVGGLIFSSLFLLPAWVILLFLGMAPTFDGSGVGLVVMFSIVSVTIGELAYFLGKQDGKREAELQAEYRKAHDLPPTHELPPL